MDFKKARATYRQNAPVQRQMAKNLISYLTKISGNYYDVIFEIGAGTGFLTDEIKTSLKCKKLILNDINENFTNHTPNLYLKGDITKINLPSNVDLILSNAVFQWIDDIENLFFKLHNSLKKGGTLCFSYFGEKNFRQIKAITGIGLNYPPLDDVLKNTGFEPVFYEEELQTLYFKDLHDVLNHIKLTGAKAKNISWTKGDFLKFEKSYLENYNDDLGFELTYHPVYWAARAI